MSQSSQKPEATASPDQPNLPRRRRGVARVGSLLDSAEQVFANHGYAAATMTEIAERAGAPIGSLYQFFPSKEAMARGVLERSFAVLHAELDALVGQDFDPPGLADALAMAMVRHAVGRAAGMALLSEGPASLQGVRGEVRAGLRIRIARLLRAAAPGIDERRAAQVAVMVLQMSKTVVLAPGQTPEVDGLDEAFARLLRAALPVWLS